MKNSHRFYTALASATLAFSLGTGIASATPVAAPTPTEPMPVTVHPKASKIGNAQPPIEWTVWAAPHAIIPDGKAAAGYNTFPQGMPQSDLWGNPMRYSDFYDSKAQCQKKIQHRTPADAMAPHYYVALLLNKGEKSQSQYCYQIANGKWVYEYTQYGDPDRGESVRR